MSDSEKTDAMEPTADETPAGEDLEAPEADAEAETAADEAVQPEAAAEETSEAAAEAEESAGAAEATTEAAAEAEKPSAAEPESAAEAPKTEDAAAAPEAAAAEPEAPQEAAAEEPAAPEPQPAADTAEAPQHSFEELKGKTVAQLREIAEGVGDVDALHGYTTMHKEELLVALCKALGIEAHEHHEVVGIDKTAVKAKIRALKKEREALIAAKDAKQLKIVRRRIRSLKRKIHKAKV